MTQSFGSNSAYQYTRFRPSLGDINRITAHLVMKGNAASPVVMTSDEFCSVAGRYIHFSYRVRYYNGKANPGQRLRWLLMRMQAYPAHGRSTFYLWHYDLERLLADYIAALPFWNNFYVLQQPSSIGVVEYFAGCAAWHEVHSSFFNWNRYLESLSDLIETIISLQLVSL